VPIHREPLYTPRRDLVADYPTYRDTISWRLPTLYQIDPGQGCVEGVPDHPDLRRLVEYEAARRDAVQPVARRIAAGDVFVEINPYDANNAGVRNGDKVWVTGPEGASQGHGTGTERVGRGVAFMPFPFRRSLQGQDLRGKYRKAPTLMCSANRPTPRRPTAMTR